MIQALPALSSPVGPYYAMEEAEGLVKSQGWRMLETAGKGWRRVVPSPRPQEIIELHTIMDAVGHGHLIIAGGGGGIPVIRDECGGLHPERKRMAARSAWWIHTPVRESV